VVVAARALRHIAGELRLAGAISPDKAARLLYLMGYPAPRLPMLSPARRPEFVQRPSLDDSEWRDTIEKWLQGVHGDLRPLVAGNGTVIAEVCRFEVRHHRKTYQMERIRAPFLEVGVNDDLEEWYALLPQAVLFNGIRAIGEKPASTIVRRLSQSHFPEVPEFQLTICPHWLRRLEWRSHKDNWLVFLDKSNEVVATIVWWRDGGPVDIDDEVIWGEGVYVLLTPAGRAQIEAVAGPLPVLAKAHRICPTDSSSETPISRRALSRD